VTVDKNNTLPGFLEGLFDKAVGVFNKIADIEVAKREFDVQRDVQLFREKQAFAGGSGNQTSFASDPREIISGVPNTTLFIAAAGLGIVGLVLLTR